MSPDELDAMRLTEQVFAFATHEGFEGNSEADSACDRLQLMLVDFRNLLAVDVFEYGHKFITKYY